VNKPKHRPQKHARPARGVDAAKLRGDTAVVLERFQRHVLCDIRWRVENPVLTLCEARFLRSRIPHHTQSASGAVRIKDVWEQLAKVIVMSHGFDLPNCLRFIPVELRGKRREVPSISMRKPSEALSKAGIRGENTREPAQDAHGDKSPRSPLGHGFVRGRGGKPFGAGAKHRTEPRGLVGAAQRAANLGCRGTEVARALLGGRGDRRPGLRN
jgi:hypothetical protein